MKVMVCGSIGYGGVDKIKEFYNRIKKEGFEIVNHVEEQNMDYSDIKDFRNRPELIEKIVTHDLEYVEKSDVLVVITSKPSYGTAIEMYLGKELGKKIISFSPELVPTPWPLYFSDFIVKNEIELFETLKKLQNECTLVNPK